MVLASSSPFAPDSGTTLTLRVYKNRVPKCVGLDVLLAHVPLPEMASTLLFFETGSIALGSMYFLP